jgi:hypothetical protein
MKRLLLMSVVAIVATTSNSYAQYAGDALRFSQTNYGSTARFKGLGGAQIGVGGDMSSLSGNPAGLGLFTKSEFSFTPEFNSNNSTANFLNVENSTTKGQLNLNQIGAVLFTPVYKQKGQDTKKGLISGVFGIGYTRNNDYSMESNYNGTNGDNSLTDYFVQLAGNTAPSNLDDGSLERMAYDNYLISHDNVQNDYFSETFVNKAANQYNQQSKNELRSGSVSEFSFSAAANISNKLYLGLSVGLIDIKYNSDAQFVETGRAREYNSSGVLTGNNIDYNLKYNQTQETTGSGLNGKLGIIFRPVDNLRLGATVQTPTWFVIDDSYTEGLDNTGTIRGTNESKTYDFTYKLRTPLKGSFGASYIIAGTAIISADIDYIDYASARISSSPGFSDPTTINNTNSSIRNNYQSAVNYRLGAEYKIDKLSLRGGYGINGSPYKSDTDGAFDTKMYSGGLGYRINNYYFDLAYQRVEVSNTTSPYTLNNLKEPVANVINKKDNFFLTFGLRF